VYLGAGETVNGGTGNATFYDTAATIGDTIAGGNGTNALHIQNGGSLTMGSNITGVPSVFLDNSATYDFTANATAGLALFAGTGNDTIAVGAASQRVIGSSGTLTVQATAAQAGMTISSGTGSATLEITTGGTTTLNNGDTNLTVQLQAATHLGLGGLGFITAIGAASGGDTITAGGANQTLESLGGNDTLTGSSKFGDTFLGTSAGLAGDTITGFGGSDAIDITDMVSSSVQPYVFNTAKDQLTVTDGTHSVTLTFAGSYTAGSFAAPVSDGHTGTLIKFV
jgi:serralysin